MKRLSFLVLLSFFLLTACGGGGAETGKMDYEETKKMVVDILKTDDGKKAIKEIMSDEEMKSELILNEKVVTDTISKTLTSEKGVEFWKKAFEDPKFAETMASSMKDSNEKLLKELMKDPEYQGMMIDLFKDPSMQKDIIEALKSKEYREHLQQVIIETLQSPLFQSKIQEAKDKGSSESQKSGKTLNDQGGGSSSSGSGGGGGA